MADVFCASGGSNTSPYDTWAKAATSLATALAQASSNGDRVILQYDGVPSGDAELSSDTVYTFAANVSLICSTNSGTSTVTPTAMGTGNWIGNSTTNRSVSFTGANKSCYIYGLTMRTAGSVSDAVGLMNVSADGADFTYENCYLWQGNTGTSFLRMGATSSVTTETFSRCIDCTFRFGNTAQGLLLGGRVIIEGGSVSSAGSIPVTLFPDAGASANCQLIGVDLSQITDTLVGNQASGHKLISFTQCKLGSGVTPMAAQTTNPNKAGTEVYVIDCDSGDNHYQFGHYNGLGQVTVSTSIYANDGAAYVSTPTRYSWAIATTANASFANPYISPWISVHHEGTSAITPNFECVRSGSATAYKDDEVWSEWLYKGTSGFTTGTIDRSDRRAIAGSAANQTAGALGAGDWTGENATSWFGKLAPGSAITPAEIGDLCGRILVGKASVSDLYVDPTIRGS